MGDNPESDPTFNPNQNVEVKEGHDPALIDPNAKFPDETVIKNKINVDMSESQSIPHSEAEKKSENTNTNKQASMDQLVPNLPNLQISVVDSRSHKEAQEGEAKQPQIPQIAEGFYYAEDHVETTIEDTTITRNLVKIHTIMGYDSVRNYNLHILDTNHILFCAGITYQILNINTLEKQVFYSRDGGGIGSVTVHPSKRYFAVAEKGVYPNIYVYEYPSLKLYRILRKGTERSYSSINFSANGLTLAAVGRDPDYTISLWNWKQELLILKSKAFSQEVYSVNFSQYTEYVLTTSGMGHIKLWKVAETFTGLKLKGEIGKFGQVEISDVVSYYTFPDGKVLSSTEYGQLLLWEGNMIKCVISLEENPETNCHQSEINAIFKFENDIVTAGSDGFIKFWEAGAIDNSQPDDFGNFYLKPLTEIQIFTDGDQPANIITITTCDDFWLIRDTNGKIHKLKFTSEVKSEFTVSTVITMNAGALLDIAPSPILNAYVTGDKQGGVRLWDLANKREFYSRLFSGKATSVEWIPFNKQNNGRAVVVGFSNGIVRWLLLNQTGFHLLKAYKVHQTQITHIRVSPDGSVLCVTAKDGDIFLMELNSTDLQRIEPFCLYETKLKITDINWDRNGEKLIMCTPEGKIYQNKVPKKDECDTQETYLRDFVTRSWTMKMMESQKPKTEEMDLEFLLRRSKNDDKKEEIEWEPAPILNVVYFDQGCTKILATCDGQFQGLLYVIDMAKDRPLDGIPLPKTQTTYLKFEEYGDVLVIGFVDGSWELRHKFDLKSWMHVMSHDKDIGRIKKIVLNFERNCLITCSEDGTTASYSFEMDSLKQLARGDVISNFNYPPIQGGLNQTTFIEKIEIFDEEEVDIENENIYSIQQAQLLAEEDIRRSQAEQKKEKKLKKIQELRQNFHALVKKNSEIDPLARLSKEELCVDPQYIHMLQNRVEDDLQETRQELMWEQEFNKLQMQKLQSYVKDELEVDQFSIRAIQNPKVIVHTFQVRRLNKYVQENLAIIKQVIQDETQIRQELEKQEQAQKAAAAKNNQANFINLDGGNQATKENMQGTMKDKTGNLTGTMSKQEADKQKQTGINAVSNKNNFNNNQKQDDQPKGAKAEKLRFKQEEARIAALMAELDKHKPSKETFDPGHRIEIQEAMDKLGDYKLKGSSNYVVPDDQRMNVSKKRKHLFMLQELIYETKMKFNNEIKRLREQKKAIIEQITKYNARIVEINQELGKNEELITPSWDIPMELPETYYENTQEQINQFAALRQKEILAKKGGFSGGGMNSGAGNAEAPQDAVGGAAQSGKDDKDQKGDSKKDNQEQDKTGASGPAGGAADAGIKLRKGMKVQISELEEEMKSINELKLTTEKKRMQDEMQKEIEEFDKKVALCSNEKDIMESDMTIATMKVVTYYQELIILADMEDYDNKLINDLVTCRNQQQQYEDQSNGIVSQLTALAAQNAANEQDLNEQMKIFKELVNVDDTQREKIHQYYLKKHKKLKAKQKKNANNQEAGEENQDDDIEDEEDDDDDLLDDDDDEKPDIAVVENDPKIREIIDRICELEEFQETNGTLKIDLENSKKKTYDKIQMMQRELKAADDELKAYQRRKLQRVNQLFVTYFLKLDQIQNLEAMNTQNSKTKLTHKLPEDLSNSILFTQHNFDRLSSRIIELKKEETEISEKKKKLDKRKKFLDRQNKEKKAQIDELSKKLNEKYMLKFGDVIDLKILDALEPTQAVLEQREQFKLEEKESIGRVQKAKTALQEQKQRLLAAQKENTSIISKITKLGEDQMKLNKKLDNSNKQIFKDDGDDKQNQNDYERERQNLQDLVKFLNQEIEDLKTEISLFKRKGGHIYTMVTSNKKGFN